MGGRRERVAAIGGGAALVAAVLVTAAFGRAPPRPNVKAVDRPVSTDTLNGGGAEHATEVEPAGAAWGSTVVTAFQIGRYRGGAAQAIGFGVSSNSGRTWHHGILPGVTTASRPAGRFPRASDPAVAYDAAHRTWLIASLVVGSEESGLAISRSAIGRRWSAPVLASLLGNGPHGIAHDKEWIACDNGPQSPFRGRCYLSYSDVTGRRLVTRTSADGGLKWSDAVGSPDDAGRRGVDSPAAPGPQPVVLRDGTLVIPYYDADGMAAVRSTDGGASFSTTIPIATARFRPVGDLRAAPLPSAALGADGQIVLAWPDCAASGCRTDDIVVARSVDGLAWSAPTRVALGAGDHVIPAIASDPARPGRLALVAYTMSPRGLSVDFASSGDGGVTWTHPLRLSPRPMPLSWLASADGRMVGDYVAISFSAGRAVAVFALAQHPRAGRYREGIFAASIPVR